MRGMAVGLLRSLVFWGGLLVMGFILWAWRDSAAHQAFVRGRTWELASWGSGVSVARVTDGPWLAAGWEAGQEVAPGGTHSVITPRGGRAFSIRPETLAPELKTMRLARGGILTARHGEDLADFLLRWNEPGLDGALRQNARRILYGTGSSYIFSVSREGWVLFIPHWILLLAAAVAWGGLLAWRWRCMERHKRILTTMDAVA